MGNRTRAICLGVWHVAVVAGLVLAVIPQGWVPGALTSYVSARGEFSGEPLQLNVPRGGEPTAVLELRMAEGVCRVYIEHEGGSYPLFSAQTVSYIRAVPAGSRLVLDPEGNPGSYEVGMGLPWQWLGPKNRRFFLLPVSLAMLASVLLLRRRNALLMRLQRRRLLFLATLSVISGAFLYPAVHELGHMLVGVALGAEADWEGASWTALSAEGPHASFRSIPEHVLPWMSAGGTVLPILVSLLLLLAHGVVSRRAPWSVSAALLTVSMLFLVSAVGCLFELYRETHMDLLAVHLGLTGPVRVFFSVSPFLVAAAIALWTGPGLRRLVESLRTQPNEETPRSGLDAS